MAKTIQDIVIIPECWERQVITGEVKYAYKHKYDRTLWNVEKIENCGIICLWTITAHGAVNRRTSEVFRFWDDYEEI